jgi:hypothetical protein
MIVSSFAAQEIELTSIRMGPCPALPALQACRLLQLFPAFLGLHASQLFPTIQNPQASRPFQVLQAFLVLQTLELFQKLHACPISRIPSSVPDVPDVSSTPKPPGKLPAITGAVDTDTTEATADVDSTADESTADDNSLADCKLPTR